MARLQVDVVSLFPDVPGPAKSRVQPYPFRRDLLKLLKDLQPRSGLLLCLTPMPHTICVSPCQLARLPQHMQHPRSVLR